ncbi:hypothetical protein ACFE04_026085 [Oxalis oulophora]
MPKNKIIYSFFKRIETNDNDTTQPTSPIEIEQTHVEVENEEDTLNHGDGVEVETENMESPTPTRPSPAKVMRTGQENIDLEDGEIRHTFNMGIGMVLVVSTETSFRILEDTNGGVYLIGEVVLGRGVTYH